MAVIGLDLGGTKLAAALFTPDGMVLRRQVTPLAGRTGPEVGRLVAEHAEALVEAARAQDRQVHAVAASVPGIAHADTGRVWAPNIPGWEDYPLRDELAHALAADVQVEVDSDRACYILGETWQGGAQGCRDAVFLAVGTGIGAGIMADGRVLRGHADVAGAIGWMALDRPYREVYETCGCFEHHASGTGIAKVARARLAERTDYHGSLRQVAPDALTAEAVFAAFEDGDRLATDVLDEAVGYWGMAVANLVSLFNPEMIVFGGGVFGPAARLLERIREEAARWAQPISMQQVTLGVSQLGADAGLYGAGRLALAAASAPADAAP